MALDVKKAKIPGTDEWWIIRLSEKLGSRLPRIRELEGWMEGNPPALAAPDDKGNAGFERIRKFARLNLAELIINAPLYRMQPLAFKTAAAGDENGDKEASRYWKANDMKVSSAKIIEWMLTFADSYSSVGLRNPADRTSGPLIRPEHPAEVITEDDPNNPGFALAALKIYRDDLTNSDIAILYRDGYYRVAFHEGSTSVLPRKNQLKWRISPGSWSWAVPEVDEADVIVNAEGEPVNPTYTKAPPIHRFQNRQGKGEFEKHLATLERINHTILQRMIIIAFQAFRQRGIKGVPNTDKDGKEVDYRDIFQSDPGAVWILPEIAEFWESGQADINPVLTAVKDDIIHLAVSSSTPLFSVVPDAANGSAEGAALQREGLIFKTEACISLADGAFCRTMGSVFEIVGDNERADYQQIEGLWASPRRSSLQERATAGVQATVAGVPWRTRMELFIELTPAQIAEAENQRLEDAFMKSLMGEDGQATSIPGITDPPRTTI
jgi:hypothetical protein